MTQKQSLLFAIGNLALAIFMTGMWFTRFWSASAPIVLQDELLFSYMAVVDPSINAFSNTIFSGLFSLAGNCGTDFLTCGRGINSILWVAFAAAISFIIYSSRSLPVGIFGLWVSTSVISFFVATFLPEVLYYCLVSIALIILAYGLGSRKNQLTIYVIVGVFFGLALLSKPHSFFILVIAVTAVLLIQFVNKVRLKQAIIGPLIVLASALVLRVVIAFLSGDANPLALFNGYLGQGDELPSFVDPFPIARPEVESSPESLFGAALLATALPYAVVAAFLFAPPLVAGIYFLLKDEEKENPGLPGLVIFSSAAFGMLVVSYLFGAYATSLGDDHTDRILLRYSEFLVPLAWLYLIFTLSKLSHSSKTLWLASSIPFLMGAGATAFGGLSGAKLQSTDSVLLFSFSGWAGWYWMLVIGGAGLLALAKWRSTTLLTTSVAIFASGFAATSILQLEEQSRFHLQESESRSPIFSALEGVSGEDVIIIGSKRAEVAALLLESGKLDAKYALVNGYSEVPQSWIRNYDVAVVSTEIYPPSDSREIASTADGTISVFELRASAGTIADELYAESPQVASFSSVGVVTDWGYWVDGHVTTVQFLSNLKPSSRVVVELIRHQSTEIEGLMVVVGGEELPIALPGAGTMYEVELTVGTEGLDSLDISYEDSVEIAYSEGMGKFSFGLGRIRVFDE